MVKTRQELIKKYISFFKSKKHKEIPNASLVPANDPTVLFTTAGMHPLVPYLTGQPHPLGKRLVNVQRCIRTGDIDETGDNIHGTFFEMIGNWSLGDYWKEDAIKLTLEFLTTLGFKKEYLAVTVFKGNKNAPKDTESAEIWQSLDIPKERIAFLPKEENWWGPAGNVGPCGPCTEIFYWANTKEKPPKTYNPEDPTWVEIGNNVFMAYNKTSAGKFEELKQKNVDFGGGLVRQLAVLNNIDDIFKTTAYTPIIQAIEKVAEKKYDHSEDTKKSMRIVADHIKAAVMILADDHMIKPANISHGYVLRRLIRRAIRHGKLLDIEENFTTKLYPAIAAIYPDYSELKTSKKFILAQLEEEENKFRNTLQKGLNQFNKLTKNKSSLTGKETFLLFQSFGFPIEMTQELAAEHDIALKKKEFDAEYQKHQKLSQTQSAGAFKSGLADNAEATTRLHTATHLLNEALRQVLGPDVKQRGSNITPERLRFDFNFPRKLTPEEITQVEDLVNEKIRQNLEVAREELPLKTALAQGAQAEFGHKYPEKVSVYTILDKSDTRGFFSKEICTGPHVKNTKEIGTFKITKEQSSAAGVRRIKATIQ